MVVAETARHSTAAACHDSRDADELEQLRPGGLANHVVVFFTTHVVVKLPDGSR